LKTDELFALIKNLSETEGVAGDEKAITKKIAELFKGCEKKQIGRSLLVSLFPKREGKKNILIDAHIDRVGFRVTYITDDVFLKVGNVGGIDARILPAAKVYVMGKSSVLTGVISTKPPHLSGDDKAAPKIADIAIDIGMNRETAEREIELGAAVYLDNTCEKLLGDRITGAAFDNRAGAAVIISAAKELALKYGKKTEDKCANLPDCNIFLLFSEGEEVTERGAKIAAAGLSFDTAIVVDTSFARGNGEDKRISGEMGKGVMIGFSSALDSDLSNEMKKTAEENKIPYQIEVMPAKTGTNADALSLTPGGAKSVTLSFPIRNMHTPVEVLSLCDIAATADLIVKYIGGVKS
jgi:endoglucanase